MEAREINQDIVDGLHSVEKEMSGTRRSLGDTCTLGSVHKDDASPEGDGISLSAVLDAVKDITQRLDQLNAMGGITRIRPFRLRSAKRKLQAQQNIDVKNLPIKSDQSVSSVTSVKNTGNSNSIEFQENTSPLEVDASTKPAFREESLSAKRAIQASQCERDSSVKRHPGPDEFQYIFELNEEMSSFAKHLMKRECEEDQDNRIALKFDVRLFTGEGAETERQATSTTGTPNFLQERRNGEQTGRPSSQGSSIDSTQPEKYVEEEFWNDLVKIETQQGKRFHKTRERGMDTIICLDISDSMKGRPWEQAMTFAQRFVRSVQGHTKLSDTVFEHLGIAVFGHETKVIKHMTVDYVEVLRKLESLRPGGPTPLFGGIHMCGAISFGSGSRFPAQKILMNPRILLITDGHLTNSLMVSGPDVLPSEDETREKAAVYALVARLGQTIKFNIYPVPVGDADLDFLQMLASATGGKLISPDKWEQTARFFKNVQIAGRASTVALLGTGLLELPDLPGVKVDTDQLWVPAVQQAEDATDEDMEEVKEIIKHNRVKDDDEEHHERDPSMPNLGTRVKRGKDWKWNDQDCNSTGTVVTHSRLKGWLVVSWDKSANGKGGNNSYRYGAEGCYDVEVVDDPRILSDELIAVGCVVKRGVDWKWRNQDGGAGNTGVVLSVEPNGNAYVRWSNGHINTYRFGYDGMFDIEVCDTMTEKHQTAHAQIKKNVTAPGARGGHSRVLNKNEIKDSTEMTSGESSYITDMNMKNKQLIADESESGKLERLNMMNRRNDQLSSKTETELQQIARNQESHDVQSKSGDFIWQWKDREGIWRPYSSDINDKLERTFQKNPKSSTVIHLGNTTYRIIFSRMQQLDTMTRVCTEIRRLSPAR